MIVSDLLHVQAVLVPLESDDRNSAVAALVEALPLPESAAAQRGSIRAAVLAREAAGSTGLGSGIAIPHARIPGLHRTMMAVGLLAKPVDFESADGKKVFLIFLLAIRAEEPHSYLPVLAGLSRLAGDEKLLHRLQRAAGPEELFKLISDLSLT